MEYGTVCDGMVFIQKNPKCKNGEYWMKMDHFLRVHGADYFERKAAFKKRQYPSEEERKQRRDANKEKKREYARSYAAKKRKESPEKRREYDKAYRDRKKEIPEYVAMRKAAYERFKAKEKEKSLPLRLERQRIREEKAAAKANARETRLAMIAENKAKRKLEQSLREPRVRLTESEKKKRRRDEKRNYKHRRRAILRNQESKATPKQIRNAMVKAKGVCYYCGKRDKLTIDHVIPIARGGSHTLDNIVFACHMCNSQKSDMAANDFAKKHGLLIV